MSDDAAHRHRQQMPQTPQTPQMHPSDFGMGRLYWTIRDAVIGGNASTGEIVLWNPAAARIFGYREEEVLGQLLEILVPESLRRQHREGLQRYARTGHGAVIDSPVPVVLPARRKGGQQLMIELMLAPLPTPPHAPPESRFALAIVRDVTERTRLEAERTQEREARRAAQLALAVQNQFLSAAAHELKTPLTSLSATAQLVLHRYQREGVFAPNRLERALRTITAQSRKLAQLVDQLLDVSRLEAGRLRLERRPTDLVPLTDGVLQVVQALTEAHTLTLHAPDSLVVPVDPVRLEQVLMNLLTNAVKYSPAGGAITVDLYTPRADTVHLAVRDHGIGVAPADHERIFERFYQAQPVLHAPGLGLGLYISREIVELHGGTLTVESPQEGGARFVITLPIGPSPGL
ncbi:MAG TPA: HAMP domain-containing sensor histidine kinase [Chloroflexota bacterium]|nr:HAMP domain-containing sensor histidine kinase [Chloroflexota bacterium]